MKLTDIPNGVRFYREWFDVFSRALSGRTQGMLYEEICDWFFDAGEELDGKPAQRDKSDDVDKVEDSVRDVGRQLIRWGLVSTTKDHSQRRTRTFGMPLPPVDRMILSKSGASLAKRSEWVRNAGILRRILGTLGVSALDKLRIPLAVINLVLTVVRVAANWNTISATTLSIVAGLLLLFAMFGRSDHH